MTYDDGEFDQILNEMDSDDAVGRQVARTKILEATAVKPEKAAKSIEYSRELALPPQIVSEDYDKYEPEYRAKRNADYIAPRPHLTDFINSHPMAAAIAQDDYENLDHWHDTLGLLYHGTTELSWDRVSSAFGEVVQGLSSTFSAIPKQAALVSRTVAEGRKEGLDRLADTGDYDPEDPASVAAYRQRRAVVHPSLENIEERRQTLDQITSKPVEEDPLYQAGEAIDEFFKHLAPTNEAYQGEFFTSKLPSAIGSMIGFVAGGALFASLKGAEGIQLIPMPMAIATLGSVSQSVDQFEDAIKSGASIEDALTSSGYGALIGTSEALPIVHFLDRLDKLAGGTVKKSLVNILKQGSEEAIQSFGQKVGSNVVANRIVGYDPDRADFAGGADDATVGFAAGALMQTIAELMVGKRGRSGAGREAAERVKVIKTYLDAGEAPSPGIDAFMDAAHVLAAEGDLKNFQDAKKAADKTQTKELAPDLAEDFAQGSSQEMKVHVPVDVVLQLYGDEIPEEGDGKLGFIPNLIETVRSMAEAGGDVEISLAGLLAHAKPEVIDQIEEHIRFRQDGMTAAEAKEFKDKEEPKEGEFVQSPPTSPEALVEREAGTQVLASRVRQQVTLKKVKEEPDANYPNDPPYSHFDILNEKGQKVGDVQVQETAKGVLYIPWIGGYKPRAGQKARDVGQPHVFGLHSTMSLFEQLSREYPNAKAVGGWRVGGARTANPAWAEMPLESFRNKPEEGAKFLASISPDAQAQVKITWEETFSGWKSDNGFRLMWSKAKGKYELFNSKFQLVDLAGSTDEAEKIINNLPKNWGLMPSEIPDFPGTQTVKFPEYGVTMKFRKHEMLIQHEQEVADAIRKIVGQLAPGVPVAVVDKVFGTAEGVNQESDFRGIYAPGQSINHSMIAVALEGPKSIGVALHEVIHHLRRGFFTENEWKILEKAAKDGGWITNNIKQGYPDASAETLFEEAIAERYRKWVLEESEGVISDPQEAVKLFQRIKELFAKIKDRLEEIFGKDVTFDQLFTQVTAGEIGSRTPGPYTRHGAQNQLSAMVTQATEAEEAQMFARGRDMGMTQASFKRWMKNIDEQRAILQQRAEKRAAKIAQVHQSEEWKANSGKVFEEVKNAINAQGDILADDYFRRGMVGGKKVEVVKINSAALTEAERKALGKHFFHKDGVDPEQFAQVFGFPNGETMIDSLMQLAKDRGEKSMKAYKNSLVSKNFQSEMMKRYGNPAMDAALQEARSDVVSDTLMDQMTEELLAAGVKAGVALSFTKQSIKQMAKAAFAKVPTSRAKNMEVFFKEAGRAAQKTEEAMLKEDWKEALKWKQRQVLNLALAMEAKAFAKKVAANEKLVERFRSREVSGVLQEYTDQIHGILRQLGEQVMRTQADLTKALAGKSLESFVNGKIANLLELDVPDFLFSSAYQTPFEKMPTEDFLAVAEGLKQLSAAGRLEQKVEKAGVKHDFKDVEDLMVQALETFAAAKPTPLDRGNSKITGLPKGWMKRTVRAYAAVHLTFETFMNRWDRFDPHGPFNQYIALPLAAAANRFDDLEREFAKKLVALKDKNPKLDEKIPNTLFIDSMTGDFFPMTRRHFRAVMANIGNHSNLLKLAEGYDLDPTVIRNWVHSIATKEDWDYAQKLGDIFAEIKEQSDRMYERLSGSAPQSIDLEPIQTRFGEYKGWYHPLVRDKLRSPLTEDERKSMTHGLQHEEYFRATTPNGYTKRRTGARYRLSLDHSVMVGRMRQMLYDIAMREAVIQTGKFFSSEKLRQAVKKHAELGVEIEGMMRPYLEDVANAANIDSEAMGLLGKASDFVRQNAISGLIGMNPGTVMKHGPTAAVQSLQEGGAAFLKEYAYSVKNLFTRLPQGGLNWKFAMETSEELRRRERHIRDTIGGGYQGALGEEGWRKTIQNVGSIPVAKSDIASAVPLWLTVYRQEMEDHGVKGEAVEMADRAVRRAHGSTTVVNQPEIMRKANALGRMFTSVYGFMNHMTNRNAELIWRIQDLYKGDYAQAAPVVGMVTKNVAQFGIKHAGKAVAAGVFAYVVWPALVEALASPLPHDDDDSIWKLAALDLGKYILSLGIGFREGAGAISTGGNPSVGLVGTIARNMYDVWKDVDAMVIKDKDKAAKLFKDATLAVAIFTGLTYAQIGRTGQFIYNYAKGEDRPSKFGTNPFMTEEDSFLRGLRYGESSPKKRRR